MWGAGLNDMGNVSAVAPLMTDLKMMTTPQTTDSDALTLSKLSVRWSEFRSRRNAMSAQTR
jgi:hypothetical protein